MLLRTCHMCNYFSSPPGSWESEDSLWLKSLTDAMAPHPAVQAVIDLSSGAIGKKTKTKNKLLLLPDCLTTENTLNEISRLIVFPDGSLNVCLRSTFWWLVCFSGSFLSVLPLPPLWFLSLITGHMWLKGHLFSLYFLKVITNQFILRVRSRPGAFLHLEFAYFACVCVRCLWCLPPIDQKTCQWGELGTRNCPKHRCQTLGPWANVIIFGPQGNTKTSPQLLYSMRTANTTNPWMLCVQWNIIFVIMTKLVYCGYFFL